MSSDSIMVDSKLKNKIETLMDFSNDEEKFGYMVKFKDIKDAFWFDTIAVLQDFLNNQAVERFYDKQLRKGFFDYINEHGETLRYYVQSKRGVLSLLKEECLGKLQN